MTHIYDSIIILCLFILFILFGLSHSVLASTKFKMKIKEKIGDKIAFYRLFYNISSLIIFIIVWEYSPKPDVIIYDLQYPFDIIIFAVQVFSLVGFFWAARYINLGEFLGVNQIKRYLEGIYDSDDLDEKTTLVINGPMKLCRHPVYLFSVLFISLRPTMDLFYLFFVITSIIYFIIGSYIEEKKLIGKYGVEYLNYQKSVKRIIPKIY
ncbi:MAG: isoprenylcysteine carboxylmethyltransferase family protein [Melioribacteraceae bacterium]|nr:isoprenylcysteine carboxylmethyltransferase family protein [Melioribacteraceae bacterium]